VVRALRPVRGIPVDRPMRWRRFAYRWMYRTGRTPWDTGITPPEVVDLIEGPAALAPGRALDLGCGTGTNVRYLAEHGWDATGVDAESLALDVAREKVGGLTGARVLLGDVTRLGSLDLEGPFDLILDIGCFHSVERSRRDGYVEGVAARTRTGATLFVFAFGPHGVVPPVGVSSAEMAHRFDPWFRPVGRIAGRKPPGAAWYRLERAEVSA
jgi:SAM-dependent methyltransferase